jgi:hypothetical protein
MLFFVQDLPENGPVLNSFAAEGKVRAPDLQDINTLIESLAEKVEALRRFL